MTPPKYNCSLSIGLPSSPAVSAVLPFKWRGLVASRQESVEGASRACSWHDDQATVRDADFRLGVGAQHKKRSRRAGGTASMTEPPSPRKFVVSKNALLLTKIWRMSVRNTNYPKEESSGANTSEKEGVERDSFPLPRFALCSGPENNQKSPRSSKCSQALPKDRRNGNEDHARRGSIAFVWACSPPPWYWQSTRCILVPVADFAVVLSTARCDWHRLSWCHAYWLTELPDAPRPGWTAYERPG